MNPFDAGFAPPSTHDLDFLRLALGREPVGVRFVAARCKSGHPRVIVNHPLQNGIPQPTTFWLVDAELFARLATLEAGGGVKAAEDWLAAEPVRAARYADENRAYAAYRWGLLSADERARLAGTPQEKVLRDSGIGGMAKGGGAIPAVKCLHLQAAWALANPQAVLGAWLHKEGRVRFAEREVE